MTGRPAFVRPARPGKIPGRQRDEPAAPDLSRAHRCRADLARAALWPAQRAREPPPPLGGVQAPQLGMEPRPPTGDSSPQIESRLPIHQSDPEQLTGLRSDPTSDAGAYRATTPGTRGRRSRTLNH